MSPRMRRKRWIQGILITVGALTLLLLLAGRFYRTIQMPMWTAMAQAEQAAMERLGLVEVHSAERFIGERPYTVLTATYATYGAEDEVIVWMWDDQIHIERQADGMNREQIRTLALEEHPEKRILRITPGVLYGEYVWEVFYELPESGGVRKYYDYYRFTDGEKIETYRLSLER